MNTTLACDVGGTWIKLGLVRDAKLIARCELPAHARHGLAAALPRIAREARRLCRRHGQVVGRLAGFGLAFPGIIEPDTQRILSTPAGKFDDARAINVAAWSARELGLPCHVTNDANAAMAGEWRYGAARGCRSAVMMTLGTGVGTSAIIDGVPLRGAHGQAGCLGGHWTLNLHGGKCLCGNVGCAEAEASSWALPAQIRAHPLRGTSPLARATRPDFEMLFRLAAQGDRLARDLREHALHVWAAALVSLIHAYDPERAIVGGGVMQSAAAILPRIRRHVSRHAWTPWGRVQVRAAALGNDAALLGLAGELAFVSGRRPGPDS